MKNNLYYFKIVAFVLLVLLFTACGHYRIKTVSLQQEHGSPMFSEHKKRKNKFKYFVHTSNELIELNNVEVTQNKYKPPQVLIEYDSVVLTGKVTTSQDADNWIRVYNYMNEDPKQNRRLESRSDKKYIVQAHVYCDSVSPPKDGIYTIRQEEMKDYVIYFKENRAMRVILILLAAGAVFCGFILALSSIFVWDLNGPNN